jgi:osmotically-inducible protein OsmY
VEVRVEGGTVRLDGLAPTAAHRDAVSEVARETAGDFVVRNEMKVQAFPEDGSSEELT